MYTLLYVDDEPTLLEIGKLFLEESGKFSVDIISSAPAALALMDTKTYDAIISDYQMPEMDGIEFLKRVRSSGNTIPFILFTGRGREEVVIQALNEGADFYLQKGGEPVSQFAELAHQVRQAVEHRRAEASIRDHERREQDIINFLPDATIAIDTKGRVIAWNRAIEEMTGIPADRMLDKGDYAYSLPFYGEPRPILIDLILSPPDEITEKYANIVREGAMLAAETTLSRLRGEPRTLWGKASLLYDKDGKVVGAIESIRDITGRKAAEGDLRKAYDVLEERVNQRTADLYIANLQLQQEIDFRQQTDSALKESEERFRTLIEKAPEAILVFDMDLDRYVEANAKAEQLFGCNRRQLFDSGPQQFYLPDQFDGRPFRETVLEHRKQVMEGAELMFERRIRNACGEDRVVEVRLVRLPSSTKRLVRSSYIDITERKRLEAELKEREERYRTIVEQDYLSILENMQDVFYRTDGKGDLILVSPSGAALLGYVGTGEMIGRPATDYYANPAQRVAFLAALRNNRSVFNMEITLKRRDGTPVTVSTNSHVYKDASGNDAGVEGIFRDITRLKQADEAFRESESWNRSILDAIPDGIIITDPVGVIRRVSPAVQRIFGYGQEELPGKPIVVVLVPEDHERVGADIALMHQGVFTGPGEYRALCADGSTLDIMANAEFIRDAAGDPTGMVFIFHDISGRKQAEEAIRQANRKLTLLSSVTRHDINNLLTLLQGYLRLLEKNRSEPVFNEYFQKAKTTVERISANIRFTREYESIGLRAPLWQDCRALIDMAAKKVTQGKVSVINDLPKGTEVFSDPLVEKVFYNLIDNALRYGEGNLTQIRFFSCKTGDTLIIACEDDGAGISSEDKEHLFERGFGKNTGLGLFLSREILSITGISITETSEPFNGARFDISVPKGSYRLAGVQEGKET
jgi:PAS domain S-box-containing protein